MKILILTFSLLMFSCRSNPEINNLKMQRLKKLKQGVFEVKVTFFKHDKYGFICENKKFNELNELMVFLENLEENKFKEGILMFSTDKYVTREKAKIFKALLDFTQKRGIDLYTYTPLSKSDPFYNKVIRKNQIGEQ